MSESGRLRQVRLVEIALYQALLSPITVADFLPRRPVIAGTVSLHRIDPRESGNAPKTARKTAAAASRLEKAFAGATVNREQALKNRIFMEAGVIKKPEHLNYASEMVDWQ